MTMLCFASTFSLTCLERHLQFLPHDAMPLCIHTHTWGGIGRVGKTASGLQMLFV